MMEGNILTKESAEILAVRGTAPVENGTKLKQSVYVKKGKTIIDSYVVTYSLLEH